MNICAGTYIHVYIHAHIYEHTYVHAFTHICIFEVHIKYIFINVSII